jgi:hypothetical protein
MRLNTRKPEVSSVWPEKDEGGRNQRFSAGVGEDIDEDLVAYGFSRLDSFGVEDPGGEAVLDVALAWRGRAGVDGASANCGAVVLVLIERREKHGKMRKWRRPDGGGKDGVGALGFAQRDKEEGACGGG